MAKFCDVCKQLVVPQEDESCPKCRKILSADASASGVRVAEISGPSESGTAPPPIPVPAPPPIPAQQPTKRSSLAFFSLICGLGGFLTLFLTGIPAIIFGHLARGEIKRSGGAIGGSGMALTGLVLGYFTSTVFMLLALAAFASPIIFKSLKRAQLAESLNNIRQVKFAMDGFASDFDGQFPNDDTAEMVLEGGTGSGSSNAYFRQLFIVGETKSESLFWVKRSTVTGDRPDDIIDRSGKPNREEILQPGDVHWAYMQEQTDTSPPGRPLILDSYKRGSQEFDEELWDDKVIVMRIDGAVKAMRMRTSDKKVLDGSNTDILSPEAKAWRESGEYPRELLSQPAPR